MYDFAFFVRRAFGQSEEEIAKEEGDTYLRPREILIEIEKYDFYTHKPWWLSIFRPYQRLDRVINELLAVVSLLGNLP
ncbi:MAG: hypothetical protein HC880_14235 [Bacteroidia bacterium]|nr:hypothetical protein [Bacteroidia bacterium]